MPPIFLADSDLGKTWKSTCEALAAKLSFDEYVTVIRSLDVDHVFWRSLFIGGSENRGVALVLETRLGALSGRLSPYFKTIISWHASARAAAGTQQYIDRNQIHNVCVVVADTPESLVVGAERLAAIIFYGPSQDLTGQWGDNVAMLLRALIKQAPQWLAEGGVVVVGENNRCAFRHRPAQKAGSGHNGGIALPGLGHHLKKLGCLGLYVGSSPMTSSHTLTPDLVLRDVVTGPTLFPKNILSLIKERVLNTRLARLLWPSFLFVISGCPRRTFLQDIFEQSELGRQSGWDGKGRVIVKRILAGNLGTTVMVAGPADRGARDVIIRLPSQPSGCRSCRVNAQALRKLAQSPLSGNVPRLLGEGVVQGQEFTVESRCPGFEAGYRARGLDGMLHQACDAVSVLHRQTTRRVLVTDAVFNEIVAPLIQDLVDYCPQDVGQRLNRFMEVLRTSMLGQAVSLGYIHGDFKLGNFLFDRSGKLTALIDWDGFSENGFQMFDYLTLIAYKMSYENNINLADIYLQYVLPWKLPPAYTQLVDDQIKTLMVDEESFLFVRIVFWFSLNFYRFDGLYKYHATWQLQFLLPVLTEFEKIHQSGWRRS